MSLAEALIGILAPPTCVGCGTEGRGLCLACRETDILPYGEKCFSCGQLSPRARTCDRCRRSGGPRHVWVSTDYNGLARELIAVYKFQHQRAIVSTLAEVMADNLLAFNSDDELAASNYVITFVPTATSRIRQRGFDHAKLLALELSRRLRLDRATALVRVGQQQQVGARRTVRQRQAEAAYEIGNATAIRGRNVLLIDDVVTTGATLAAAAKQLRRSGAKRVDALVFAKRL